MSKHKKQKQKKHFLKNRFVLITASILIVILSAFITCIFLFTNYMNFITPEKQVAEITNEAEQNDNVKSAQEKLTALANKESDPDNKTAYLLGSSDLYYNSNDFKNGIIVAKNIEALEKSNLSAANLAFGYMGLGDYENAAKYYQIAADRSEKPVSKTAISSYNDYLILKNKAESLIK